MDNGILRQAGELEPVQIAKGIDPRALHFPPRHLKSAERIGVHGHEALAAKVAKRLDVLLIGAGKDNRSKTVQRLALAHVPQCQESLRSEAFLDEYVGTRIRDHEIQPTRLQQLGQRVVGYGHNRELKGRQMLVEIIGGWLPCGHGPGHAFMGKDADLDCRRGRCSGLRVSGLESQAQEHPP